MAAEQKLKKGTAQLQLELARTRDILAEVSTVRRPDQVVVGFAAETENLIENARDKLQRKGLDLIVANDARQAMGADSNKVTLIGAEGSQIELPLLSKDEVAGRILEQVVQLLTSTE